MLLLLVLGCLAAATARADDAPILTGSHTSIADAVAKSDLIFESKLNNVGTSDETINAHAKYIGPIYLGAQVEAMSFYKGKVVGPLPLTISLNDSYHETAPVVGQSYLFFVSGPRADGTYMVMKLLPATMENRRATLRAVEEETRKKILDNPQAAPSAAQ